MIRASLIALYSTLMICGFCGKEFVSLGRHTLRCKNKINFNGNVEENAVPAVEFCAQECLSPSSYKVARDEKLDWYEIGRRGKYDANLVD